MLQHHRKREESEHYWWHSLEVHVWSGGDSARGLDCHWLGPGAITLPGQGSHLGLLLVSQYMALVLYFLHNFYLYFVFCVWLESCNVVRGHFRISSIEPQWLAVVLVHSLLDTQN